MALLLHYSLLHVLVSSFSAFFLYYATWLGSFLFSRSSSSETKADKLKNEQVRLSLLAHRDDGTSAEIPFADGGLPDYSPPSTSNGNAKTCNGNGVNGVIKRERKVISAPNYFHLYPPRPPPPENDWACLLYTGNTFLSGLLLLIFALGFPLYFAFYILACVARLLVRIVLSSRATTATLLPISRVFRSTLSGNYNSVLVVCSGQCDLQKIRRSFMNAINTGHFYKLKKRLANVMGYLCLENCPGRFDIKHHVKYFEGVTPSSERVLSEIEVISYLESRYGCKFENREEKLGKLPQWEVTVIPRYLPTKKRCPGQHYALLFRFHNGIMDWTSFREFLTQYLGRTGGQLKRDFRPFTSKKHGCSLWLVIKVVLAMFVVGPVQIMRKLVRWSTFENLIMELREKRVVGKLSLGKTRPMCMETWEDMSQLSSTTNHTILESCARMSVRNLMLTQGLDWPKDLSITRVFEETVDSTFISYERVRKCLQRLHATFYAVEGGCVGLAAQRLFNLIMLLMAGTFPVCIADRLQRIILKGNVIMEIWHGVDESIQVFGGDLVTDIIGWSGVDKRNTYFKLVISTYCGKARGTVTARLGQIPGYLSVAQTVANEFEEEYEQICTATNVSQTRLFVD